MSIRPTVTLSGNVGKIGEMKFSKQGKAVLRVAIAVNERIKDGNDWVDGETSWFDVTVFGGIAEGLSDNVKTGDRILVHGRVKKNLWEDKEGVKHSNVEIIAEEIGIIPFAKKSRRVVRQDQMESAPF